MQRYRTLDTTRFGPGARLALDDDQLRRRIGTGAIAPVAGKAGQVDVLRTVEFKRGEIVAVVDATMDRALEQRLEPVDAEGTPAEAERRPAKKKGAAS